jgi:sensitive to high expression protein 9, mitochondrial
MPPLTEQLVRARHQAVQSAKSSLDTALDQRNTSQKSVVALLERKSSWAASDLETYMSLIRSEHAHDQAVEASKDAVATAELALEEARARLERRERSQYHEEQIWSDTIRRNGTWVTLGLMGVNIALLVVNLVAVEPWRRRKLVGEIKGLLKADIETKKEALEALDTSEAENASVEATPAATGENADNTVSQTNTAVEEPTALPVDPYQPLNLEWISSYLRNPFGEQIIEIRKTDLTGLALQSAGVGYLLTWLVLYFIWRQR